MSIHGFMTFLLLPFVFSSKGKKREKWQQGHKRAAGSSLCPITQIDEILYQKKRRAYKWTK